MLVPDVRPSADSQMIDLPGGRRGFCKANHFRRDDWVIVDNVQKDDWCTLSVRDRAGITHNTYVLENPDDKPVGARMSACVLTQIPAGWAVVEWFTDSTRCAFDPYWKYKGDPNMMLIERVRWGRAGPRGRGARGEFSTRR